MAKQQDNSNGSKVSWEQVYNVLTPMNTDITTIKTLLTTHLSNYEKDCIKNNNEHKGFITSKMVKAVIWVFGSFATVATVWGIITSFVIQ